MVEELFGQQSKRAYCIEDAVREITELAEGDLSRRNARPSALQVFALLASEDPAMNELVAALEQSLNVSQRLQQVLCSRSVATVQSGGGRLDLPSNRPLQPPIA